MRRVLIRTALVTVLLGGIGYFAARLVDPDALRSSTYASISTVCPGDVNRDDLRDVRDVVLIQAHLLGKKVLSGEQLAVSDVNQDGTVDVLDVVRLTQHVTRRKLLADCFGAMAVSPGQLTFGDVRVGGNKDLTVSVSNAGNATLAVASMTTDNGQFSTPSPAVPFTVSAGAERLVTVRYSPSSVGSHSGALTISATSGGAAMSATVGLTGAGLVGANPSPVLTRITPDAATKGSPAITLTLDGGSFIQGSVVLWDGSPRPTTYVNGSRLQAAISASDLAQHDGVVVRVQNPAPGGGLSDPLVFLISPLPKAPDSRFWIRYIAPLKGPASGKFTILGQGFSPVMANNKVTFFNTGDINGVKATVISATDTTINGIVPAALAPGKYAVYVTVGSASTSTVGFEVTTAAASLNLRPEKAFLLMPPGSGKEYLVIGGGTPPYKLKPLSAAQQAFARVELKGTVVEVTGLSVGATGTSDVTVEVEDSAPTPAQDSTLVKVQTPKYNPDFTVIPHNLLAGSAPGFTIRVDTHQADMRTVRTRIKIEKARTDVSNVVADGYLGFGNEDDVDFNAAHTTAVDAANSRVGFDIIRTYEDGLDTIGRGTCEPAGITLFEEPTPPPESVVPMGTTSNFVFFPGIYQLPPTPDESFNITAVFTSSTVDETKNAPLFVVRTRSFKTVGVQAGGPAIQSMLPDSGEIGREVWIFGSGFSTNAANNQVTFAGPGTTRVPGVVKSAKADKLSVYVPDDAQNGLVKVSVNGKSSNGHEFWARFHPDADVNLIANPPRGGPKCLVLMLKQPKWETAIASLNLVLDKGTVNATPLTAGSSAGKVLLANEFDTQANDVIYAGQETGGAHRHIFEVRSSTSSSSVEFCVFVSPGTGGQGIKLEAPLGEWSDGVLLGRTLYLVFDKPWYSGPAPGTQVTASIKVESAQWLYFNNSEMLVRMTRKVTMP